MLFSKNLWSVWKWSITLSFPDGYCFLFPLLLNPDTGWKFQTTTLFPFESSFVMSTSDLQCLICSYMQEFWQQTMKMLVCFMISAFSLSVPSCSFQLSFWMVFHFNYLPVVHNSQWFVLHYSCCPAVCEMQQWVECHPGALIHSGEVEQIVYGDRNGRHRFSVNMLTGVIWVASQYMNCY